MKAVILAGGLGTRLRPFTEVIPKPLLPVGEQSLMEVQIRRLEAAGVSSIFIATNYKSDFVKAYLGDGSKYGVELTFSEEEKPLGTCGPLSLLRDRLDEDFIVMNGDILTKLDFAVLGEFGRNQQSLLTVGTKILLTPFRFGNVIVDDNDRIVSVEEKPELKMEIVAGIYYMKKEILDLIPDDTYFGMDTLIRNMLDNDMPISRYQIRDYWIDVGQVDDYTSAREEFSQHFDEEKNG